MTNPKSFMIVGAGLVGLATAFRLREHYPKSRILVLEKEEKVGMHQSTHNSGVLHAGLYYRPGSAKAKLAVTGIRQMVDFCRRENIAHDICGKLVVAVTEEELPRLDELLLRGRANGLHGLRKLDQSEIRKIEPHAYGIAAIHVPEEGIVDYRQVCDRLAERIIEEGGEIVTSTEVTRLRQSNGIWIAQTPRSEYQAEFLINCGGLHCDRIANAAGEKINTRIVPFRGEYYQLKSNAAGLVRNLIYPVPDPQFPFLGVHFTRLINGRIEAGPNAVLAFAREGYGISTLKIRDLMETFSFPGFWRFFLKYPRMATHEFAQSLSKERFCRSLQRLVPDVRLEDLEPGGSGVRAQAMNRDGNLVDDFDLVRGKDSLHVLNAPSPAATASLAIGAHLVAQIAG